MDPDVLPVTPVEWRPLVHGDDPNALACGFGPLHPKLVRQMRRGLGIRQSNASTDTHVLLEEADLWLRSRLLARLRRANAVSASFLAITFNRLLDDFRDHKFGTHEPPAEVRRLGGLHLCIFRHLCQQQMTLPEVIGLLDVEYGISSTDALAYIREVRVLAQRTGCGHGHSTVGDADEILQALPDTEESDPSRRAEDNEEQLQLRELLRAVRARLRLSDDEVQSILASGGFDRDHPPTQALVMHLHYVHDLSMAQIAEKLHMNARTVQRIKGDGLARFQQEFAAKRASGKD